jgi:ABC-type thiamine transport system substrate-binding protein
MTKWIRSSLIEKEGAMKGLMITIVTIAGLLLVASLAYADMSQLEMYYNDQITKKIVNCKRIASMENHTNSCMVQLIEMRSAQAEFYKKHREELVKEMVDSNLGKKPHKIDHFLITKFQDST